MLPEISIIIPVFNQEMYLEQCLQSIEVQSFSDFEVILVNDGSKDSSISICESYVQKDSRFKLFTKENGGVSSARNIGIEHTRGKYVIFIDADDMIYPKYLERLVSSMTPEVDMVIGGYEVLDESDLVKYSIPDRSIIKLTREECIKQMYRPSPYRYQGYIWNKIFRRSIIEDNHIRFDEDISFNEDRLFITKYIVAQSGKTVMDSTPIYKYYERKTGAMASLEQSYNPKFYDDFVALIRMRKIIRRTFQSSELNNLTKVAILHSYVWIHNMMKKFDAFDKSLHSKMTLQLIMNTSIPFFVKAKLGL